MLTTAAKVYTLAPPPFTVATYSQTDWNLDRLAAVNSHNLLPLTFARGNSQAACSYELRHAFASCYGSAIIIGLCCKVRFAREEHRESTVG